MKDLYHHKLQVLKLTEEKNNLLQLLQISYKTREYFLNMVMDSSTESANAKNEEEIARLKELLRQKEEELVTAKRQFLSLCQEMHRKLKELVNEREPLPPAEEDENSDMVYI